MGNCFSDPSKPPGKGQRLGSASDQPSSSSNTSNTVGGAANRPPPRNAASPPRALGGGGGADGDGAARDRALKAAEERAKAAQGKGVHSANPKAGKLSAQLAAERKSPSTATPQGNERMMDRGEWN